MCWWIFKKPKPPVPYEPAKKRALLFAINNYPGVSDDLYGCLNDQSDVETKLNQFSPGFDIRKYSNAEVTVSKFISELDSAVSVLRSGDILLVHYSGHGTQVYDTHGDELDGYDEALYLHDGALIDDDINALLMKIPDGAKVVIALDSCFSGTATRNPTEVRTKFLPYKERPVRKLLRNQFARRSFGMKWIVFSGCQEDQTSADAEINGRYNGAFTYFWLKSLFGGMTYQEWLDSTQVALFQARFEQIPTLEGKEEMFNEIVFS